MEVKIHNNLSCSVMRLYNKSLEAEKTRIEAEKAERERKANEWKEAHYNMSTYCYSSISFPRPTTDDYYKRTFCNRIYFYEWSDIYSKPRFFGCCLDFFEFLDGCGIRLTEEQANAIKPKLYQASCAPELHFICKRGCRDLLMKPSYEGLLSLVCTNSVLGGMYG